MYINRWFIDDFLLVGKKVLVLKARTFDQSSYGFYENQWISSDFSYISNIWFLIDFFQYYYQLFSKKSYLK